MPLSFSLLASGAPNPGGTTATTASVTAPASGVIFLCFDQYAGTPQAPSSVSGLGGTWTSVRAINPWGSNKAMFVWQGVGCSGSGTITITFPNNADGCRYQAIAAADCDTTTPVVQSNGTSGTGTGTGFITAATTLSAFGSAENGVLCFAMSDDYNGTPAAGSGYTQIGSTTDGSWGSVDLFTQYRADNDTAPACQMGQNASVDDWAMIAIEVAAGASAPSKSLGLLLRGCG